MAIHYDVLPDEETGLWFFIVFSDEDAYIYQSQPAFDSEEEAETNVLRWIADNLIAPPDATRKKREAQRASLP
ncbi:MAG: hypothetical protein AB1810_03420 [Pseudomonadota bacterium]